MDSSSGPVEGEGDHLQVSLLHLGADGVVDEGAVGRHAHAQALSRAVFGDVEDVGAQQRLATGEDHDRFGDLADIVDELVGLGGIEVAGGGVHVGGTATMDAVEVAALGRLPGNPLGDEFGVHGGHDLSPCRQVIQGTPGVEGNSTPGSAVMARI